MPIQKFIGPCVICGRQEPDGYYKKHMCNNCYRKQRRRARGLQKSGISPYNGPCIVCGAYESSNKRFINKMCRACYKRMNNSGNLMPRVRYRGPCIRCGISDSSLKYVRKMCPACYHKYRELVYGDGQRRRARMNGVEQTLTEEQWRQVLEFYNYTCAYCGKEIRDCYTMDHVIPISKQGRHSIDNVVPSCLSCNSRKYDRKPPHPVIVLMEDGSTKISKG